MPVSARSSTCLLLAASLLLAACTTVRSQPAGPDSADPVEAYLVRLGLVDHAIEYLEGELAKNPKREALARGLADHYANRLLDAGNPAELDQFQGKIADLLAKHPGLRTPQLDTIVLQGDFLRGKKISATGSSTRRTPRPGTAPQRSLPVSVPHCGPTRPRWTPPVSS